MIVAAIERESLLLIGVALYLPVFLLGLAWFARANLEWLKAAAGQGLVPRPITVGELDRGASFGPSPAEQMRRLRTMLRAYTTPLQSPQDERWRQRMRRRLVVVLCSIPIGATAFPLTTWLVGTYAAEAGPASFPFIAAIAALLAWSYWGIAEAGIAYGDGRNRPRRELIVRLGRLAAFLALLAAATYDMA